MKIDSKVIDQLLADYEKPEDIIGENGLLKQLTKALVERALQAELTAHFGYEKHSPEGHKAAPCWRRVRYRVVSNTRAAPTSLARDLLESAYRNALSPQS